MYESVLITGAAGFLGSHLCDRFIKDGFKVYAMDNLITGSMSNLEHLSNNKYFKFIHHDVSEYISFDDDLDYILHFASPASPIDYLKIPIQTLKVSSLGTHNLLGLAKAKKARILVASTSEVYGDPLVHPQNEDYFGNVNPIGPRGVYDEAKRFQESLTLAYHRFHKIDTRIVRIFNTYGPRMRIKDARQTFLGIWIKNLLQGKPIQVFGDGKQRRDYNYVEDVLDALLIAAAEKNAIGKVYNLGAPDPLSLEDTAKIMCQKTESGDYQMIPFPEDRKAIDVGDFICDYSAFRDQFGWEPKVSFEEGIQRSIEYFRKEIEHYI